MENEKELPLVNDNVGGGKKTERNSNLELLRIILMIAIIAHHFVVNSDIGSFCYDLSNIGINAVFLQLWGMWGKTAINCFVLISGYFMCTSNLTRRRFFKVYLPTKFYNFLFYIIFLIFGYEIISTKRILKLFFSNIKEINSLFSGSFLAFYLFIPFLNLIVNKFDKKQLGCLTASLVFLFSFILTFFKQESIFTEFSWYMVLYFVASYIRLYPNKFTESKKFAGVSLLIFVILSYASVVCVDIVGVKIDVDLSITDYYYFVSNSSKILAFLVSLSCFLFFKNCKPRYNKFVNTVASTTFGVLLIHSNSDAMRKWLWHDLLHVESMCVLPFWQLMLYSVGIALAVFIVCSIIDYLRIILVERPFFKLLDKNKEKVDRFFSKIKNFFLRIYLWAKNLLSKIA